VTLSAGASAHAAAAGNWRWLTGLTRTGDALFAGNVEQPLPHILALQFAHVVSLDRAHAGTAEALASLADGAFDYAVLHGALEWWSGDMPALCRTAHRLLRDGGWLAVAGNRDRRAGRLADELRAAGFRTIRRYSLSPDYERPFMVIPRTRSAALACERDAQRQRGGHRARVALAAAGQHELLYRGWLVIAAR